jgi:hypothetical protein
VMTGSPRRNRPPSRRRLSLPFACSCSRWPGPCCWRRAVVAAARVVHRALAPAARRPRRSPPLGLPPLRGRCRPRHARHAVRWSTSETRPPTGRHRRSSFPTGGGGHPPSCSGSVSRPPTWRSRGRAQSTRPRRYGLFDATPLLEPGYSRASGYTGRMERLYVDSSTIAHSVYQAAAAVASPR